MTTPTMDLPVTIRPARATDLPEVHRMICGLAAQRGQSVTITPRLLAQIAQGPAARILVAVRQDSPQTYPVGHVLLLIERNMIAGADWGMVEQLHVQEPDRRRGIGRALVAAARAEAALCGAAGVTIMTHPCCDGAVLAFRAARPLDVPPAWGVAAE
ncbi:GNAT family N-acetyltransferase [Tabrizicola caldifontis]|uniref:GNAT family N-acetyltransferase n=1 Tax=Tabrizicola caldifontis TaxID=2528036 RepID=UPI00107FE83D|nr:GNAT family N-acetyltransferase [Rhodobacter sp. YIM 73028]